MVKKMFWSGILLALAVYCSQEVSFSKDSKEGGRDLFEAKCSLCHGLDRPTSKRKTSEEWEKTVLRMKRNGAPITDKEMEIIVKYLSEHYGK